MLLVWWWWWRVRGWRGCARCEWCREWMWSLKMGVWVRVAGNGETGLVCGIVSCLCRVESGEGNADVERDATAVDVSDSSPV